MPYFAQDDIVQISSPPGRGLLGVLRLSGPGIFRLLETFLHPPENPERRGRGVRDLAFRLPLEVYAGPEGKKQVTKTCPIRLFLMPGPASYTREDVAEVHFPGSPAILSAAMAALTRAGARPAAPGEFTFRAFQNGRLTLSQAEAVEAAIRADNQAEAKAALTRLGDPHPGRLKQWRDRLMDIAASLEAAMDFDEAELDGDPAAGLAALVRELTTEGVDAIAAEKTRFHELPHAALLGLTNAGKSSLFNQLLERDEVLVSAQSSTTRDHLRREVEWAGVHLAISDNPGEDPDTRGGAQEAVALARRRLGGEDVACWVVDASRPWNERLAAFAERLTGTVLVALNKADLPPALSEEQVVRGLATNTCFPLAVIPVSAATGEGVEALRLALAEACREATPAGGWNTRESLELIAALAHCRLALAELAGPGRLELASEEVRSGLAAFSRALGDGYAEEALERIFSRFCLGK